MLQEGGVLEDEELRALVYGHLPYIDELLTEAQIPIHKRFSLAAFKFVQTTITDPKSGTAEDIRGSDWYFKTLLPICNDWYWDKYGKLAKGSSSDEMSGIANSYAQPILLKIPTQTSKVETEGETTWLTFPDHLTETESYKSIVAEEIKFDKLSEKELFELEKEITEIVFLTRNIFVNFMSISGLDKESSDMSFGIWRHFEKAISDILSLKYAVTAIGCWELHLAIEKTLKIFIKQHSGNKKLGHDLIKLTKTAKLSGLVLDEKEILSLPGDKEAIKLRYAELIKSPQQAVDYYKTALRIVNEVSSQYKREYKFNNASFLIKKSPWAK